MRRSVTLQRRDTGQNEFGELNEDWTTVGTLGANIRPFSLSEITSLNRESSVVILQFDFLRSPTSIAITESDRLVYSGENYDVISISSGTNSLGDIRVIAERRT